MEIEEPIGTAKYRGLSTRSGPQRWEHTRIGRERERETGDIGAWFLNFIEDSRLVTCLMRKISGREKEEREMYK